jgi:hypothetical protein
MSLKVNLSGEETWLFPTKEWKETKVKDDKAEVKVDPDFYVASMKITN